jgi:hypothetical protein
MSAFASLILLFFIATVAMAVVAYANYQVAYTKRIKLRLQKYRVRVEELEDVVLALDQLCESRGIPKLVNDEVIETYETMIGLDSKAGYLKAGKANAKMRSDELSNDLAPRQITRLCNSDAQIARLRAYLSEASRIVRKQHGQGKISTTEVQNFTTELEWLYLQVYVISNIAQGHKAYSRQDVLTANAFYKKAQTELMRSGHPDERRHKMIKQLADVLFGRRKSLDKELMPEDEFNPENTETILSEEDQRALTEILLGDDTDHNQIPNIAEAMIVHKQNTKQQRTATQKTR